MVFWEYNKKSYFINLAINLEHNLRLFLDLKALKCINPLFVALMFTSIMVYPCRIHAVFRHHMSSLTKPGLDWINLNLSKIINH